MILRGMRPMCLGACKELQMDKKLESAIKEKATDGRLTCDEAWQLADDLGINKADMGKAADDLGIKIKSCQLGCF